MQDTPLSDTYSDSVTGCLDTHNKITARTRYDNKTIDIIIIELIM